MEEFAPAAQNIGSGLVSGYPNIRASGGESVNATAFIIANQSELRASTEFT